MVLCLDPFCGCGTTIDAAQKLGRRWVGIDVTKVSLDSSIDRLAHEHGLVDYTLVGEPSTAEEAKSLAS